jgi:hypothetical protein
LDTTKLIWSGVMGSSKLEDCLIWKFCVNMGNVEVFESLDVIRIREGSNSMELSIETILVSSMVCVEVASVNSVLLVLKDLRLHNFQRCGTGFCARNTKGVGIGIVGMRCYMIIRER